jgi:predicted P-loop ATPase/GTPase
MIGDHAVISYQQQGGSMRKTSIKRHVLSSLFLCLFIIFTLARISEAVEKITLDKDMKLVGSRFLPAGEIIVLEAIDVSPNIESILLTVKVNSIIQTKYLKSVESTKENKRVWSVEIGPFLPKIRVQIVMEIMSPISDDQKKALGEKISEVFDKTALDIVERFPSSMTEDDYKNILKARFLEGIKVLEIIKNLRTKTGEPLEKGVEELFSKKEFGDALGDYLESFQDISYLESALHDNLSELKGIVKEKKYEDQLKKESDEKKRKNIEEFWSKIKEDKWTSADLANKSKEEIIEALEFGKIARISDRCPSYASALIDQSRKISENKKKNETIRNLIIKLALAEVGNFNQIELESLDLEVREIEHWAGFNVGYLACDSGTKNVLPAFFIDIHLCRFNLENESMTWEWKNIRNRFSLSAGIGLSKPDRPDLADRWYFIGLGFRLNPFFRFHIGDAFFFSTAKEEDGTTKEKEWKHALSIGLSLNIRELSHVLGLFGGIKGGQNEKE